MSQQVIIFDTTLRDGEQALQASLSVKEKLQIALALERMGVDVMEVDHGWCTSIYARDPNGIMVEFCTSTRELTADDRREALRLLEAEGGEPSKNPPTRLFRAKDYAPSR